MSTQSQEQRSVCLDCSTPIEQNSKTGRKKLRCDPCIAKKRQKDQQRINLRYYHKQKKLTQVRISISSRHVRYIKKNCYNLSELVRRFLDGQIRAGKKIPQGV